MKTRSEVAVETFLSGYNCAQAVLSTYGHELGLDTETALKVATGLGAGMGRQGEVCGAVTGAILALGLKYGRGGQQDRSATERTYQKTQELIGQFEQRHGSCLCRVLLDGCDLRTPEGQQQFRDHDLLRKTCVSCVRTVADIMAELLETSEVQPDGTKRE